MLDLQVANGTSMPDSRDRGIYAFGDHCVTLVSSSEEQIELEVALQHAKQHDPARCKVACCQTAEQRRPAPDGTVECCFCSDLPGN